MQSARPGPARRAGAGDPLATDAAQALQRARQQLQSLMRNAQGGRPNPVAQRQLLREAMKNLRTGMAPAGRGLPPTDSMSAMQQLEEEKTPIDLELLRRLLAQLDRAQVERVTEHESDERPRVTHLDPPNYPPGYRDWIQRYFRRLAEQP